MSHPLLTQHPCLRCKKSPRVFWQRHPKYCRGCAKALGMTPKPHTQTPYERRPQAEIPKTKLPMTHTKPPMPYKAPSPPRKDIERDTKMVSVEEARREAARLYGSYHPGLGDE